MHYKPIQCHLYDYIEVACLRHYKLLIKLLNGEELTGLAQTIHIINKEEYLEINVAGVHQNIRLDKIKNITTLDDDAEFKTIEIS